MLGVARRPAPTAPLGHRQPRNLRSDSRHVVAVRAAHAAERNLFIFGLGYSGLAAANHFQKRGWNVSGTCRDEDKAERLRNHGVTAFTFETDGYEQLSRPALAAFHRATHVLSTVPPDGDTDPVLMAHSGDLVELRQRLKWVGYLSSTSVYGDHGSEWVDEESELLAAHGKGLSRILAEGSWVALCYEYGVPVHVFRCGGIYGPRRSALDAISREGPPSDSQERRARQRFTARCHVTDICRVLEASMMKPRVGAIYNVVDDEPAGRGEVMAYASDLMARAVAKQLHEVPSRWGQQQRQEERSQPVEYSASVKASPLQSAASYDSSGSDEVEEGQAKALNGAAMRRREVSGGGEEARRRGEKRVRNDLIKTELGVELRYPSFREGLTALAAGDRQPFA